MTFLLGNTANSARCIEDKSGKVNLHDSKEKVS